MHEWIMCFDMAHGEPPPVVDTAVLQICPAGVEVHAKLYGRELGPVEPQKFDWE